MRRLSISLSRRLCFATLPYLSACLLAAVPLQAEDADNFQVHEWSVWIAEPNLEQINPKDLYPTALPPLANPTRSRESAGGPRKPSPLGMIMFFGKPSAEVDVDLRVQKGRFLGHWPPADTKGNRLRWLDASLRDKLDEKAQLSFSAPEHWFERARKSDALYLTKGARAERFVAYDAEINSPLTIDAEGGPDKFQLRNKGSFPLHDVVISLPTPAGRRIGWLDVLPASSKPAEEKKEQKSATEHPLDQKQDVVKPAEVAPPTENKEQAFTEKPAAANPETKQTEDVKPTEIVMSAPLAAGSAELAALTHKALGERLAKTGLHPQAIELLLANYSAALLDADAMTVVYRLPTATVDEKLPLAVFPEPRKTVRVALVLVRNLNPRIRDDIETTIAKLGDPKFSEREAAQKRLLEFGSLGLPALKNALKHTDPEVVLRCERLLLEQNQAIDGRAPALQGGGPVGQWFLKAIGW